MNDARLSEALEEIVKRLDQICDRLGALNALLIQYAPQNPPHQTQTFTTPGLRPNQEQT